MKFKNYINIAEMDTKIEIKQEPCFLERNATESHSESKETLGSETRIKSESFPFASVFIMKTDSDIHGIDQKVDTITKIKEEPGGMERSSTEQQSESEDTLYSDIQVKSELSSFVPPFAVEPDSHTHMADHRINIRAKIKEESGFLARPTELKSESEEIHLKDVSLHFDTENQLSDGDQKLLMREPTRLDTGPEWNYETGIITADLDKSCLKLGENSSPCHVNTSAAHRGDIGDTVNYKILHRCEFCGICFSAASSLQIHIAIHEGKGKHKCNICDKSFRAPSSLKRHSLTHEGKKPYKCNICNKSFTEASHLRTHHLIHEGKRQYKCSICDKSFFTSSHLKKHTLIHEGIRFKCEKCDKSFNRSSSLKTHSLIHDGRLLFKCDICDKSFTVLSNLEVHILLHEGKSKYNCSICNKSFTQAAHLKTHNLIHDGKRPFKCDKCDKTFTTSSSLKEHNLIHEGKRLYKCNDCEKSFIRLTHLKRHKLTHEGKKPFKCDTCDARFTRASNMKTHTLIHKRLFKCNICDESFTQSRHLKKHILIHEDKQL